MDFYGFDREKAVNNCGNLVLGLAGRDLSNVRGWNRIRPEHIVDLLDRAAPEARGEAYKLAATLSRMPWRVLDTVTAQTGNKLVSNAREISINAAGRIYQLHCVESPSLRLERIA